MVHNRIWESMSVDFVALEFKNRLLERRFRERHWRNYSPVSWWAYFALTIYLIIRLALDAVFLQNSQDPGYVQAVSLSDIARTSANGEGSSLTFSFLAVVVLILFTFFMSSHSNILKRWVGQKLQPCISLKYAWDTWLWCAPPPTHLDPSSPLSLRLCRHFSITT